VSVDAISGGVDTACVENGATRARTTDTVDAPSARLVRGRVPDFFIVGHPKCGTTALYSMLKAHPQVYMPELKEPRFFSSDLRDRFRPPEATPLPDTLEDYLSLFACATATQRLGEASPSYLVSHVAAEEIAKLQPQARIIAILREPASFLRSLHLQFLQAHVETEADLRKAIALEGARGEGRHLPSRSHRSQMLQYSEHVRYVEQLRRYHAVFAPEQVLVLIYDDLRRDNETTMRKVLRFLEVDDAALIPIREVNPTVRVRSHRMHELVHTVSVGRDPMSRMLKRTVKALTPSGMSRGGAVALRDRLLFADPEPADERLMAELRSRYHDEVVALSEYLGRDLVRLWGYDSLG
jgi:hypothetical protein